MTSQSGHTAIQHPQANKGDPNHSSYAGVSDLFDAQVPKKRATKPDDIIDMDPCLKSLKGGYLMQRTYYNTKLATEGATSTKAGTSPMRRNSPTR